MVEPAPTPSQILQHAAERGQERQAQRVQAAKEKVSSFRERLSQAKDAVRNGWQSVKDTGAKVGNALLTGEALFRDPQIHGEIKAYAGQKVEESRDNINRKITEIKEDFNDRKEAAKNAASERILATKRTVNERVITPTVEGAKKIGRAVVTGAENGTLFVVGTAVVAYEAGKAGVEAGKKLATEVKTAAEQKVEQGKEKAREWGNKLRNYFVRQGERVKQDIRIGVAEVQATGLALSSVPDQLRTRLGEMQHQRHVARTEAERQRYDAAIQSLQKQLEGLTQTRETVLQNRQSTQEVLSNRVAETKGRIQQRQETASTLRQAARGLRTQG